MTNGKHYVTRSGSGQVTGHCKKAVPAADSAARGGKTATVSRSSKSGVFVVSKDSGNSEVVTAHDKTPETVRSIISKRRDALQRLANR
ncbi:hypothetical protein [uncultured Pseudosulfitobacter sp.]|uniref:hypothetical protein n=1 Tax=uncultured Pseudosulfitobacter sp. TaxID=2854214 RepID=UPI0030D99B1F|tara:strand:+ start:10114 stop:10377 length:264 start_codon:yes stop_codon:yes gene_type:complete